MPFGVVGHWPHVSVNTIQFCAAKKCEIEGGGWAQSQHAVYMAAVQAGYRKALVGTGWTLSHLVSIKTTPWDTISGTVGHFWSGGAFADGRALSIECSLLSGCGQGHEPPDKRIEEALAQVFGASSVLVLSRSENMNQKAYGGSRANTHGSLTLLCTALRRS